MSEKELTNDEARALVLKLQMKFGAEGQRVQEAIQKDIALYGYVSLPTIHAQQALKQRILKEKENYEVSK